MKKIAKRKMAVPLYMKVRIGISLVLTLIDLYIAFAAGDKDGRFSLLPNATSSIWLAVFLAIAALALLVLCYGKKVDQENLPAAKTVAFNTYIVTSRAAHLRHGPGKKYKSEEIFALQNDLLEGVNTADWLTILFHDKVCWINKKDCRSIETTAPEEAIQVTSECAQIYKGPGNSFMQVASVRQGTILEGIKTNGWRPVLIGEDVYWVSKNATAQYRNAP